MSKLLFAFASFAAIAGAFVVPQAGEEGAVSNFTRVETKRVGGSGVLHVHVKRKHHEKSREKRQTIDGLRNDISGYSIQIGIGTPPQYVEVQLDTGSSELWVNPTCSNSWSPAGCTANGFYNSASSSTKVVMSSTFSIQYGIGSVSGVYVSDNIAMGGAKIVAQQFGDASTSLDVMEGIMGIGWGYNMDTTYYNVIDQLAAQGVTHSRAFSLDLASIDVAQGAIIFGGIDTMKYSGALEKRPIIPYYQAPDFYPRYWIYMTSLGVTTPGSSVSLPVTTPTIHQPIFPDSGSTWCYLPAALFAGLLAFFPSAVNQGNSQYTVPCSLRDQQGTIDFGFGGTTIHVSYHEFFWFDGVQCWLAATPSTQFFLLGDSFMRSAYIVYDQDNSNVLLAQAANCGTNIVPITTGPNAVPSIIGGCTPPQSTTSSSSATRTSTSTSSRSSSTSAGASTSSKSPSSSSTKTSTVPSSTSKSTTKSSSTSSKISSSSPSLSSSSSSSAKSTPTPSTVTSKSTSTSSSSRTSSSVKSTSKTTTSTSSSHTSSSVKSTSTTASSTSSSRTSSSVKSTSKTTTSTSSPRTSSSVKSTSTTTTSISSSHTSSSVKNTSKTTTSSTKSSSSSSTLPFCKPTTTTIYVTATQAHGTCTAVGQKF